MENDEAYETLMRLKHRMEVVCHPDECTTRQRRTTTELIEFLIQYYNLIPPTDESDL